MKKLLAILLAFILVLGLTACGESSNAYWTDFEVDEITYKIGVEKDSGITILEGDVEYIFYFYKDGEKIANKGAAIMNGSLSSVQQEMEKSGTLVEQKSDDNATYAIYKNNDTSVSTTYFMIVGFKNKDGFFSFETDKDLNEIKQVYDVVYAK